ncbi:MAG: N-6 DNA methylase [gamma proteobacterium symbiont of Bathyaustriella thionipta]|nr:N-6 DNA methylase [gamma proteobacterium symbiont of Bathyaustriella thionipta]MCU7949810.1 N-6 DNA methylase [gamma proteobacterium symbiont of Bathyaustriella thionipta]MCU7951886.1 N-6 DNA methylase [gamma proteobacterium symbiont of Bathyaustriella thionipta]
MLVAERYSHVESRKREGAHYTPEIFADFISENIIQNAKLGKTIKIVDPAVGDGELLISLISVHP